MNNTNYWSRDRRSQTTTKTFYRPETKSSLTIRARADKIFAKTQSSIDLDVSSLQHFRLSQTNDEFQVINVCATDITLIESFKQRLMPIRKAIMDTTFTKKLEKSYAKTKYCRRYQTNKTRPFTQMSNAKNTKKIEPKLPRFKLYKPEMGEFGGWSIITSKYFAD